MLGHDDDREVAVSLASEVVSHAFGECDAEWAVRLRLGDKECRIGGGRIEGLLERTSLGRVERGRRPQRRRSEVAQPWHETNNELPIRGGGGAHPAWHDRGILARDARRR